MSANTLGFLHNDPMPPDILFVKIQSDMEPDWRILRSTKMNPAFLLIKDAERFLAKAGV